MIKIDGLGNLKVRDTKVAYFKIRLKAEDLKGAPSVDLDLDPTQYLQGGSKSTGLFLVDICSFVRDKFNEAVRPTSGNNLLTMDKLKDQSYLRNKLEEDCPGFNLESLDSSKEFQEQVLGKVSEPTSFACTFLNVIGAQFDYDSVIKVNFNQGISPLTIINMLYKIYLYSYSQQCRDELICNGLAILIGNYRKGAYKRARILIWDRHLNAMVEYNSNESFIARDIYPLSTSNRTTSSGVGEILPFEDSVLIGSCVGKLTELNSSLQVMTTRYHANTDVSESMVDVFTLNGYKSVENDCLVSATLRAKYKNLPTHIESEFCLMFNQPSNHEMVCMVARLIDSPLIKFKHEDIVFDLPINDIISNDKIILELKYSSYTKSGGARATEYADLATRKITPTPRRDALYDICYNTMSIANIDKIKAFAKLDVDFKRFYGYLKA